MNYFISTSNPAISAQNAASIPSIGLIFIQIGPILMFLDANAINNIYL